MDKTMRRRELLGLAAWPLVLGSGGVFGAPAACPALLDRSVPRLQDEKEQPLCQYSGKVLLIVNTASACGFTPQYQGLEKLYEQYQARGLVVLGFPSNDFAGQESGDNRQIAAFCENQFAVRFPMFIKGTVRGGRPLYADLKRLSGQSPGWNFHKYLVGAMASRCAATRARSARTIVVCGWTSKLFWTPADRCKSSQTRCIRRPLRRNH